MNQSIQREFLHILRKTGILSDRISPRSQFARELDVSLTCLAIFCFRISFPLHLHQYSTTCVERDSPFSTRNSRLDPVMASQVAFSKIRFGTQLGSLNSAIHISSPLRIRLCKHMGAGSCACSRSFAHDMVSQTSYDK